MHCTFSRHATIALIALASAWCAALAAAQTRGAAEQKAIDLCSTCHRPRGISTSPEFPILAAQQPEYFKAQLDAFRSHKRGEKDAHDFMWGIAGGIDASLIPGLADYYASQPPPPGRTGDPAQIARGRTLYDQGSPDRAIPACATCHGADGAGREGAFPRLAGQHAKYVAKQLHYIQSLTRSAPVMHGIVKELKSPEIDAVAAYVQSL
jgi:cytochrome c553